MTEKTSSVKGGISQTGRNVSLSAISSIFIQSHSGSMIEGSQEDLSSGIGLKIPSETEMI